MIKDGIKIVLIIILLITLFIDKRKVSKKQYESMYIYTLIVVILSSIYDIFITLLLISFGFILFSKIRVRESFNNKKPILNKNVEKKSVVAEKLKKQKNEAIENLPTHCYKTHDLDEEFLKEYDIEEKKLEDIQTNIFDKYNYHVYYNEQGEGSSVRLIRMEPCQDS